MDLMHSIRSVYKHNLKVIVSCHFKKADTVDHRKKEEPSDWLARHPCPMTLKCLWLLMLSSLIRKRRWAEEKHSKLALITRRGLLSKRARKHKHSSKEKSLFSDFKNLT